MMFKISEILGDLRQDELRYEHVHMYIAREMLATYV